MRPVWLLLVMTAPSLATAAPATPEAFAACKARVHALAAEAMKIADLQDRGERLVAMPQCERLPDGTLAVTEPPPAPPRDTTPFAPHVEAAARAGLATSILLAGVLDASGVGAYAELELGYRLRRRLGLAAFASFATFHDGSVYDPTSGQMFDVREQSYELGALAQAHYGALAFGGGIGLDDERYGTGYTALAPLVELFATYVVASTGGVRATVFGAISDAITTSTFTADTKDDLVRVRVAVGLEL